MYDNYQQTQSSSLSKRETESSSNFSALQRAARALSESREYVRESSVVPEEKLSRFNRTYRLEDIGGGFSSSSARDNSDYSELGNYKITVAPRASSWITPTSFNYSPQSAYTNALLEAYSPSNFPDFVFGKYGVNASGGITSKPISATQNYYDKHPLLATKFEREEISSEFPRLRKSSILDDSSEYFSSSTAARKEFDSSKFLSKSSTNSASKDYGTLARDSLADFDRDSYAKEFNRSAKPTTAARDFLLNSCAGGLVRDKELAARSFGGVTRAGSGGVRKDPKQAVRDFLAANAEDEEGIPIKRYNPYESDTFRTPLPRTSRFSKFFHYYIPKHYGGTPMLGGYLVPKAGDFTWRY
jgi:hypothetical protein